MLYRKYEMLYRKYEILYLKYEMLYQLQTRQLSINFKLLAYITLGAVMAQWFRLRLQSFISCGHGFEYQSHHLHIFLDLIDFFDR